MNKDDIVYSVCKYVVEKFDIIIPNKGFASIGKEYINGLYLEADYDDYIFPYLELTAQIPSSVMRDIKEYNSEIEADIRISYQYIEDITAATAGKIEQKIDWINGRFYLFMEDTTPDLNEKEEKLYEESQGVNYGEYSTGGLSMQKFLIYNKQYLFNTNTVCNNVLRNVTVADIITFIFHSMGISKVLMSPPTNTKKYKEFLITPITVIEQLVRLRDVYGIHKHGTIIFFDLKRAYIVSKEKKCTACGLNETKTIYLMAHTNTAKNLSLYGCYRHPDASYCAIGLHKNSINILNDSMVNNLVYGSTFTEVVKGEVTGTSEAKDKRNTSAIGLNRIRNSHEGDSTSQSTISELEENSYSVTTVLHGACIDMLTPNRQFVFTYDDAKFNQYGGAFRICKIEAIFSKEGDGFIPTVKAKFKGGNVK